MITVIGNHSANRLNYYVWKSAIDVKLIEYLPSSEAFSPDSSSKITILSYISVAEIDEEYLKSYCRKGGVFILYLFDSFSTIPDFVQHLIIKYSSNKIIKKIFSFDPSDCRSYGFSYWPQVCSMIKSVKIDSKQGFYFAGRNKGRFELVRQIAESFHKRNIGAYIRIPDLNEKESAILKGFSSVELHEYMISYEGMLDEELSYNCIFDLTQACQVGLSWRFIEGIMYGKKIVTNNPNVINSPFYNSSQVRIINTFEDLDFEWIQNTSCYCHKYNDYYSPVKFINYLKNYE